ncbi:MAG: hypothetical protein V4594_15690 [Bacteroidota bacterium]
MKCISLSIVLISLSTIGLCQSFKKLSSQADSLARKLKFEQALKFYNEAVDLALQDREAISDSEFFSTLYAAAEVASTLEGKTQSFNPFAQKYWGMIHGSRGEKMEEKVSLLIGLGVKDLIVYYPHGGHTSVYVVKGCTSNITKYLIWINGLKTYVQRFEECNSYKPVAIPNSSIAEFFPANKRTIATEKLTRIQRTTHMAIDDLTFIDEKGIYYQTTCYEFDLLDPDPEKKKRPIDEVNIPIANYQSNMETKLSKLIPMLHEAVDQYRVILSSGRERAMIGKF